MITLKIGKAVCPVCDVKSQTERFVGKWQIDNSGALLLKIKIERNWIVFFFKGKKTRKDLKIIRSSEPRARL